MLDVYQSSVLNRAELIHGFSEIRHGNMSFVWGEAAPTIENRRKFLAKLGIDINDCVQMGFSEGGKDKILVVDKSYRGRAILDYKDIITADAFITNTQKLGLFVVVADCLPALYFDPVNRVVALAHLSRQSSDLELASKVVATMAKNFASQPNNLLTFLGPCIHKQSYIVPKPFVSDLTKWEKFLTKTNDGQIAIDLVGYNKAQLLNAGVLEKNIEVSDIDTATSERFYSHYRDSRLGRPESRFCAVIMLK